MSEDPDVLILLSFAVDSFFVPRTNEICSNPNDVNIFNNYEYRKDY